MNIRRRYAVIVNTLKQNTFIHCPICCIFSSQNRAVTQPCTWHLLQNRRMLLKPGADPTLLSGEGKHKLRTCSAFEAAEKQLRAGNEQLLT